MAGETTLFFPLNWDFCPAVIRVQVQLTTPPGAVLQFVLPLASVMHNVLTKFATVLVSTLSEAWLPCI